ncbi:MAG: glycoside hydrolase family 97 protein [Planctomycetes bacterium]|nr:glycoside hydrolase family 97 protein [Planctomycetota bacterium]
MFTTHLHPGCRVTVACIVLVLSSLASALNLKSPNGAVALSFDIKDMATERGVPVYSVTFKGQPALTDSRIGFELEDHMTLADSMVMGAVQRASKNTSWLPVYGEKSLHLDHYNEMKVSVQQSEAPFHLVDFTFRCYDTGVAFATTFTSTQRNTSIKIQKERTEFSFFNDHTAWVTRSAQGDYKALPISSMGKNVERPLTMRLNGNLYVAIAEANLVDYARMKLSQSPDRPFTVVSELSSPVQATLPMTTPWRVIMMARSPGELLENNGILLNLNAPCEIADTAWIKPGKVIREVTLTTQGGKTCVDFAKAHNLQFVEFDAGWYGPESDNASDATTITVDPKRSPGPLDLHAVIRYASTKDIGILLYVNQRALTRQLDDILPLFEQWGVAGVKYGFVHVGTQEATTWLHQAIRKAAKHHLMVDVHDEYRPTGYSRTYPNLMTQEGIRGDETKPSNQTTLTILFTRMLAGAGDNTICYYDSRVAKNASHAYQLAKAVCFYSPWQFLYWYDRPHGSPGTEGAGGERQGIGNEPELAFFDAVPTVWDETRVIHGKIGKYAVMARRSGTDWFIGSMNSTQERTLDIPLDFLEPGRTYTAHVYSDDPAIPTRTHVRIDHKDVTAQTTHRATMTAQGGQAIHLELKR